MNHFIEIFHWSTFIFLIKFNCFWVEWNESFTALQVLHWFILIFVHHKLWIELIGSFTATLVHWFVFVFVHHNFFIELNRSKTAIRIHWFVFTFFDHNLCIKWNKFLATAHIHLHWFFKKLCAWVFQLIHFRISKWTLRLIWLRVLLPFVCNWDSWLS